MRVIAGTLRSRTLQAPAGLATRPTSDRLRETLFNVLGTEIAGAHFIDIFAGTGAVGIEALSRGAAEVVFIEHHAPAAALIRKNLEALGIRGGATVLPSDALRGLAMLAGRAESEPAFTHAFLDPPYADALNYHRVLGYLAAAKFLGGHAVVIAEHRHSFQSPEQVGALSRVRILRQGDAALSFYRREPLR